MERKHKIMQINLMIFSEDEDKDFLGNFMYEMIDVANNNAIAVKNVVLGGKEMFSLNIK